MKKMFSTHFHLGCFYHFFWIERCPPNAIVFQHPNLYKFHALKQVQFCCLQIIHSSNEIKKIIKNKKNVSMDFSQHYLLHKNFTRKILNLINWFVFDLIFLIYLISEIFYIFCGRPCTQNIVQIYFILHYTILQHIIWKSSILLRILGKCVPSVQQTEHAHNKVVQLCISFSVYILLEMHMLYLVYLVAIYNIIICLFI